MNETTVTNNGKVLTLERIIDAPKDKVWEAWTTAEQFAKWWGPRGWKTTVKQFDFTPNGSLLYGMKCEDENQKEWFGQESWGKSVYATISPRDSFSYVDYFCDSDGNVTEGMPVANVVIEFTEVESGTKIYSISTFESEQELNQILEMGMEQGIKETWDRLTELVE